MFLVLVFVFDFTMDYEVDNITFNFTFNETYPEYSAERHLARAIMTTFFGFAGIAGNAVIIYIIFHYKRLQTMTNIILANWAIAHSGFLLVIFDFFRLMSVICDLDIPSIVMCFVFQLQESCFLLVVTFMNWMIINWCLGAYWPEKQMWFRKHFKIILAVIWGALALWTTALSVLCELKIYFKYRYFLTPLSFYVLIGIVIGTHIVSGIQKFRKKVSRQSALMKMIPTVLILTWIFAIFLNLLLSFSGWWYLAIMDIIAILTVYSNPYVVLIMLLRYHKGFQSCFYQTLKRSKIYSSESLDNSSQESIANDKVHVTFDSGEPIQVT